MKFFPTPLRGAYVIEPEPRQDERGFFSRIFCRDELGANGIDTPITQINDSYSALSHTLRGMHYQIAPHAEVKIVRCIQGRLFDAIVDLRSSSPTFKQWFGVELSAENRRLLYVPKGFAHGFMTLEPNTEMLYFVSDAYAPSAEKGLRWNDPEIAVHWPYEPKLISDRDMANPLLCESDWLN